jgi:hypothetical protein
MRQSVRSLVSSSLCVVCATITTVLWQQPAAAKDFNPDNPLNPPVPLYWCPGNSPDEQLALKQSAGCTPLYDEAAEEALRARARKDGVFLSDRDPIKTSELQQAAAKFLVRYHTFMSCCPTAEDAQAQIVELTDEANHILKSAQQKGMVTVTGPGTLAQVLTSVAIARERLFKLNERLERLQETHQTLHDAPFEAGGRIRTQIQEDEDAIRREFKPAKVPSSAPTGMDIQDTTLRPRIGGEIEDTRLGPNFGTDIGGASLRPRRGEAIQDSTLQSRPGTEAGETSIPHSTGRGLEQTEEAPSTIPLRGIGSAIGDSEFNSPRR